MDNSEKLRNSFAKALNIDINRVNDNLKYQSIKEWDSISHMMLISVIEEDFGISLDTDDVIDMNSVGKAKEIIGKHNIHF